LLDKADPDVAAEIVRMFTAEGIDVLAPMITFWYVSTGMYFLLALSLEFNPCSPSRITIPSEREARLSTHRPKEVFSKN